MRKQKKSLIINNYRKTTKNTEGFTLVELLAAITILGIITALSIPLIRGIQDSNEKRKFTTYRDSLENSAKLYVDSYSEDLFGHKDGGCAYITWDQLYEKDLTEDIQMAGISCNSENSFVKVVKYKEHYNYYPSLGCGNKKNGEASTVNVTLPDSKKAQEIEEESCGGPDTSSMTIKASPNSYTEKDRQKVGIKISITSPTGINVQKSISYAWSKTNAYSASLDWKPLDITIPTKENQETGIISGKIVTAISKQLLTPSNQTGDYYLVIKVDALSDLFGTVWNAGDTEKKNYVIFGKYTIDNTSPVITSLKVDSNTGNYNNINTKVTVNATDNNKLSQDSELKMCISTSENGCSSASKYIKYTTTSNLKVSNSYDGKEKNIYVNIKDRAGNIAKESIKYTVYKECTNTVTDNKWIDKTSCTVKCGGGTKEQESGSVDSNTKVKCSEKKTQTITCNTQTCCTGDKIKSYGTWSCNVKCGTGTNVRTNTWVRCNGTTYTKNETGGSCNTGINCCSQVNLGAWSGWSSWKCSTTCGEGTNIRTRTRIKTSKFNGQNCGTDIGTGTGSGCTSTSTCKVVRDCRQGTEIHYTKTARFNVNVSGYLKAAEKFYVFREDGKFYYGRSARGITGYVYKTCTNDSGKYCPKGCKG